MNIRSDISKKAVLVQYYNTMVSRALDPYVYLINILPSRKHTSVLIVSSF